jgi:hypothetical protein
MFAHEVHHTESAGRLRRFKGTAFPVLAHTGFDRKREDRPFAFINLPALFPGQRRQPSHFHKLPHSSVCVENSTPAFPMASALFVFSFTKEQKSTLLFSGAYALFLRSGGRAKNFVRNLGNQQFGLSPTRAAGKVPESRYPTARSRRSRCAQAAAPARTFPIAKPALSSLFTLLCTRSTRNFRCFSHLRTLWKNHPGGGRGLMPPAFEPSLQLSKQALRHRPFGFRIDETTAGAQTLCVMH